MRSLICVLCVLGASVAHAGPVCEGGKCALRAAKTVVVAPVKVARRAASLPSRAIRAARSR